MPQNTTAPVWRARAPVRIDLAGGWTDVPPFSAEVGGAVVNAAINRYAYATLLPRPDERIQIVSADFDQFLEVRSFRDLEYDGKLDLIKAAVRRLGIQRGMDIFVRCDAPPGSGTGSSASIGVALLGCSTCCRATASPPARSPNWPICWKPRSCTWRAASRISTPRRWAG